MAHRDFSEANGGGREARSRSGRGEVSTAAFRPGLEKNGSVEGYMGLELARGGTNGC